MTAARTRGPETGTGQPVRVLFVCTGNTCRSPMAAAWFDHLCAQRGVTGIRADCAGLAAVDGEPISPEAVDVLAREGVRPLRGRSRGVTPELVAAVDLIVVMTASHKALLDRRFPDARGKTRTLLSFAGRVEDVADPIGGSRDAYARSLEGMKPALQRLLEGVAGAGI